TGRCLASVSHDGAVRQWDLDTGRPTAWAGRPRHAGRALALAYSPDGRILASAGQDRTVRTWDARTGVPLETFVGHEDPVLGLAFSADGRRLASGDGGGVARLWDLTAPAVTRVLRGHDLFVYGVAVDPDGSLVWSASWDGTLRAWDADSGQPVASMPFAPLRDVVPRALALRPDGRQVALLEQPIEEPESLRSWVRLIDLPGGDSRVVFRADEPGHKAKLAYSRDGALLVASDVSNAHAVVLETGSFGEVGRVTAAGPCALSPGGPTLLATTSAEHHVLLHDLPGLTPRHELVAHRSPVRALAFSHDGTLLFSGGDDWTVHVWDCATGEQVAALEKHTGAVYSIALSPDGTRLATGSADHSVRLWDTATFEEVCHLHGHDEYVFELAWAPDGRRLYTASGDATVRIWELDPLRVRQTARAERHRLVADLAPRIDRLVDAQPSAGAVAAMLRADPALGDRERQVALQLVLGRALGDAPTRE
ncbi:MAG: WD40 repeat domain-containing protein, partial [Planctomycetota bacterium]